MLCFFYKAKPWTSDFSRPSAFAFVYLWISSLEAQSVLYRSNRKISAVFSSPSWAPLVHLLGLSTLWEPSPDLWALAVSLVGNQAWPKSTHSASNSNWLSIPVSTQNSYLWLGAQNSKLSFCSFFMSLSPTVIQSWGEIPQVSPLTLLQKNGFACLPCQWTLPLFWTQTAWCLGVCLSPESK